MSVSFESTVLAARTRKHEEELVRTARSIGTPGKGILAADESPGTINSRFAGLQIEETAATRQRYREMLFTTPSIEQAVSGVILHPETLEQRLSSGEAVPAYLQSRGMLVGVKVDLGTRQLPAFLSGTKYSIGLDTLPERAARFYEAGARFAKWRSVLVLSSTGLDAVAVTQVAREQALYASVCQEAGLVPIVEPELLMDGNHSRAETQFAAEKILAAVFKALSDFNVLLEGVLLKPAMVLSGIGCKDDGSLQKRITADAAATVAALRRTVPAAVPAITFLSGGQREEEATLRLNAINTNPSALPWQVTFSFARALQMEAMKVWAGQDANKEKAQKVFHDRVRRNGEAQKGQLKIAWDAVELGESLFIKDYAY